MRRDGPFRLRVAVGLVVVLSGFALPASAIQADVGFSPPAYLSAPEGSILHAPDAAIGADDTAMVVWSRYLSDVTRVEAVRIAADGTPGPVLTLSESTEPAWSPKIALDAEGGATAVWYQGSGSHRIMAVHVSADGVPGPVRALSSGRIPEVVVDSQGRATVVWYSGGGVTLRIEGVRLDDHGMPGIVRTLSSPGEGGFLPKAAVDSQDRVTAVWSGDQYVQSVRIGADGASEAIRNLSRGTYGQGLPDVAVDSRDQATAVWQEDVDVADREHQNDWRRVKSVRIGSDGVPGTVWTLSGPGQALGPDVAIDASDRAVVVWEDQLPRAAMLVRVGADGTPGTVRTLGSAVGDMGTPVVAADRSGGATAVWGETLRMFPTPDGAIRAVHVGPMDALGPLQTLPATSDGVYHSSPALVIDSHNRVTVVWKRSDAQGRGRVQMARGGEDLEPPPEQPPPDPPFDPPGPPFDPPGPPLDPPGPPFGPPGPPLDPPGPPFGPPGPPLILPPDEPWRSLTAHARLRVAQRGIAVGGRLLLRAACRSREDCRGKLTVVARRRARGAQRDRPDVFARGRYRLEASTRNIVRARLSRRGQRLLRRWRRPTIVVQVHAGGGPPRRVRVRAQAGWSALRGAR
jgi:hypothetical protein